MSFLRLQGFNIISFPLQVGKQFCCIWWLLKYKTVSHPLRMMLLEAGETHDYSNPLL